MDSESGTALALDMAPVLDISLAFYMEFELDME